MAQIGSDAVASRLHRDGNISNFQVAARTAGHVTRESAAARVLRAVLNACESAPKVFFF